MSQGLTFRRATLDDAAFAADVFTAVWPRNPTDPVLLRYSWETAGPSWVVERFVVERSGTASGFAFTEHPRWDLAERRWASVGGDLWPAERHNLDALFSAMEERALAGGADILRARANEDDPERIATILRRGYREDRRGKRWELDLAANRERLSAMAEASRERMRREGIRLLTLADDSDHEKYSKVWRMSEEATQDIPRTLPHVPESLEDYLHWIKAPDMREDRFWIARMSDDIVGVSVLSFPPVRGLVGTAWTATSRSVRGRGVARALKCETLIQAIALGVDRVRTGNDAANDPILHINASMGYQPVPGAIDFLKRG
jgi:hypothetical protein